MTQTASPETGGSTARETKATRAVTQIRTLVFDVDARATDSETIPVVISTDAVVEVSDGPEILVHTPDAVDLQRAPLPIIATHRSGQINVGVVENLRIANGQLRGDARFGARQEAADYRTDVLNRIIRSVSVGYSRIKAKMRADGVLVTSRWMPMHTAMVAEPADAGAGFFRSEDTDRTAVIDVTDAAPTATETGAEVFVPPTPASPAATTRSKSMTEQVNTAAAGANAGQQQQNLSAIEAERLRQEAIRNLVKANHIDSRVEMRWIEEGASLDRVSKELLDVMEARQTAKPSGAAMLGLSKGDTQRFSMIRAIRALKFPTTRNLQEAAFEIDCSNAVSKQLNRGDINSSMLIPTDILNRPVDAAAVQRAQRAMSTLSGPKGDYMVSVDNGGFIDILRNRSVAMQMGSRQLSGLVGNVQFPRQTGKSTVTWQGGDGSSVTASDQTLGQLSMTPKTAIIITDVSEQLLRQSNPSAEAFITADLAATIAIDGVDNAVINGTGGAQPIGIKNTSGITSGQDASSATYAKILAFVSTAGANNAIRGNPGWVTTTAGAAKLMQVQRFSSTDTPVWTGNMLNGSLVGFNAMSSEQLSSGNIIFGSWDEVVIGDWGVLELSTDTGGTRFNQAQVGIRALWMVDVMLRYPQAFVVGTNLS